MAFKLPNLPYAKNALEPHFDERTMGIHHGKHHQGYTNKLNAAIEGTPLAKLSIEEICSKAGKHGAAVRNNGGGYYNHSLFWEILSPKGGGAPSKTGKFGKAFYAAFKSYEAFKIAFAKAAGTRFGSGWAWVAVSRSGKLFITSTPNQDNPLMDVADKKGTPVLGLDVWEHAYYLKYQNVRPDYISAFFNLINWSEVSKKYNAAIAPKKKAKKTVAKKATAKKATAKKVVAKKVAKKAAPKKATAKKATAKKAVAKTTAAKKTTAKKAVAKKVVAKKATAKKAVAKKAVKKVTVKRAVAKKAAPKRVIKKIATTKKVSLRAVAKKK